MMLKTYEKAMLATTNISNIRKIKRGLLYVSTKPYFKMTVNTAAVIVICKKLVMNHASQCTALFKPIVFMTYKINTYIY